MIVAAVGLSAGRPAAPASLPKQTVVCVFGGTFRDLVCFFRLALGFSEQEAAARAAVMLKGEWKL